VLLAALCAAIAGCSGVAIPPTYTQEELGAICQRHGAVWHSDTLMGGFCEYQSASLTQAP
jgi:adenosylmethionine-8-amino-7-oxononanoate aminotransferase